MKGFPEIRVLGSKEELEALTAAAKADNHEPLMPTHIFWKVLADGHPEVVGYASICALVPLVAGAQPRAAQFHTWFHTKLTGRDSFYLINALENIIASTCPAETALVPCWSGSPFNGLMESMGYARLMDTTLWARPIRKVI